MKQVHEVLIDALKDLRANGWIKGDLGSINGPKCASGALRVAVCGQMSIPGITVEEQLFQASRTALLRAAVEDSLSEGTEDIRGVYNVPTWNDKDGRTFEEVESAFERAILNTLPIELSFEEALKETI